MSGKHFWLRRNFKGVLFDMDGVLLDSSSLHASAFEVVLRKFGVESVDYSTVAGMRTEAALASFSRRFGLGLSEHAIADLAKQKRDVTTEQFERQLPLAQSCLEVLAFFRGRGKIGLVSSSSRASVDRLVAYCRKGHVEFDAVLSGEDVLNSKPAPDGYLKVLELMAMKPSETFAVEDSVAGVRSATAASIRVVGLAGTSTPEELRQAGALTAIQSLSQLMSDADL